MRVGIAKHRYEDGSHSFVEVHLASETSKGFPIVLRERDGDPWYDLGLSGAGQARRLSELLARAADRLERRGQP